MSVLHAAVIQLHTIEESTTEILGAIAGFENVVHFHGTDGHFLQSLGNKKPVIYLGKVIDHFLLPASRIVQRALCERMLRKLSQLVAEANLKEQWTLACTRKDDCVSALQIFKCGKPRNVSLEILKGGFLLLAD